MDMRTAIVGLWLATGCGPGTGGSSEGGSSGGGTTAAGTDGATTTSGAVTGGSSGGGTGTGDGSTGAPTSGTSSTGATTSSGSTGGPACDEVVGSMDCAELVAFSGELTLEQCETCQGAPCGTIADCDSQFPCKDGSIVIRACCTDEQCADLSPFCGMFIAVDRVCVNDDDI